MTTMTMMTRMLIMTRTKDDCNEVEDEDGDDDEDEEELIGKGGVQFLDSDEGETNN